MFGRHKVRFIATSVLIAACCAVVPSLTRVHGQAQTNKAPAPPNKDAVTLEAFKKRMQDYVALHKKIETGAAKLPDKATPQQIDTAQRELGKGIIAARVKAKQGDIFGADGGELFRRLLKPVFTGPNGPALKQAISEEPHPAIPAVNARYPDDVPLSTMPPDVLKALPELEEEIEFRFIGRHLIILDPHAHLVIDVLPNAMPA